jgi:C-terminal processing protease CtpA/Prc
LVIKDQFAWKLGFRPGDFVVAVESKPISHMTELKAAIGSNLGKKLTITILRGNVEKALIIKIPKEIPKEFLRD